MLRRVLRAEPTWQLMDQAAVSAGNFLTTVALARRLMPEQYGTFSLLFLSLFAINTIHASLVIYPLTLNAATADPDRIGSIAGESALQTLTLAPLQSLALLATALFVHRLDLLPLLILTMVAWQLQETVRRTLLAHRRPRSAFFPDALSYLGQGALVLLLHPHTLTAVFTIVAATSSTAAAIQFILLKTNLRSAFERRHFIAAWGLGRFTLAGNLLTMLMLQTPAWALATFSGRGTVAGYQSLANLVGVANPIIFSVSNLLIPTIARAAKEGAAAAKAAMYKYGFLFASLLIPVFAALLIWPTFCMTLVYGRSSPYLALAPLLRILGPAFMFDYVSIVVGAYEGGYGRPRTYMLVQIVGIFTLFTAGLALIRTFGLAGAAYSLITVSVVRLTAFILLSNHFDLASRAALTPSMTYARKETL